MDVRDIKGNPPPERMGDLKYIFELQTELVTMYQEIENFPDFPLDLDLRQHQTLFKDFVARVTEETGEAFESVLHIEEIWSVGMDDVKRKNILYLIANFNEEMADALHFMVEACLSIGITADDLAVTVPAPSTLGLLSDLLGMNDFASYRQIHYNPEKPIDPYLIQETDPEYSLFIHGGRRMYAGYTNLLARWSWMVTYQLQIARNALKNKPWKQTEMMSDKRVLKVEMVKAFQALMDLFSFCGMTPESITDIYWRKNQVNRFRIQSKY